MARFTSRRCCLSSLICALALLTWHLLQLRLRVPPLVTPTATPAAPAAPAVLLLLELPGCEPEVLVQQLLVPLLQRMQGDADAASALCHVGTPRWRAKCIAADGLLRPSIRVIVSPHLRVAQRSRRPPLVIVPLRDPLERLVAAFNQRREEHRTRRATASTICTQRGMRIRRRADSAAQAAARAGGCSSANAGSSRQPA